ncbi:serine hydrolase domain-containing protein [Allostreptomyces psammosilenae]|uniref:CubicO group peptidase (Beta-lactamase class C family) n=1 Tax=Allostreptomyces psammosilenae TaxID=1892865 RepID=A0A853ABW3_9ACTN|nr:serine hydrolase domain-containing protein [Allostreptomyces psammosilenae]NYI07862.1 CubicO group peptidase (beta-lactamase class C family) [Allostreptomyces psammosilenae]
MTTAALDDGEHTATDIAIDGETAPGFEPVRRAFAVTLARSGGAGAALALYHHGRKVVDLWGGAADPGETGAEPGQAGAHPGRTGADRAARPWEIDTLQLVRSATKGVLAASAALLVQRRRIALDEPVATYWPEFAAAGKAALTVRQALAHQGGLPALDHPLTPEQVYAWHPAAEAVARQAPAWEPGTAHGYHPQTYGWLIGELIRRVDGRTPGAFLAEEIAGPLDLDFWIGLPEEHEDRVGRLTEIALAEAGAGAGSTAPAAAAAGPRLRPKRAIADAYADPDSLTRRSFAVVTPGYDENSRAHRAAEQPAANGVTDARSLARFYAAVSGQLDGAGGAALLDPSVLAEFTTEHAAGPDRVLIAPTRFGLGWMLGGPAEPMTGPAAFGHPGRGGSLGFADPERGIAFGYVTGGLLRSTTGDPRARALARAVRESLQG